MTKYYKIPETHHFDKRADQIAQQGESADPDDLIDTTELGLWLGMSTQWVENGRLKGYGPPWIKLGPRRIRYKRSAVLQWLEERQQASIDKLIKKRRHKRTRLNDPKEAAE